MGAPIDDQRRAGILDALRANLAGHEVRSRADIAREYGVAPSTVRNIADAAGIDRPFDTTTTRTATVAARDHLRARRAQLASDLLDDVAFVRGLLRGPYRRTVMTEDGPERVLADDTDIAAALRNNLTAVGIAVDKHIALDRHDTGDGADEAISMLGKLATGLEAAHRQLTAGDHTDPTGEQ